MSIDVVARALAAKSAAEGTPGASAYELAVQNGFPGTEAQWLASLQGAPGGPGDPGDPGQPGAPGNPGSPGKSAYEVAVDNGFAGSQAEWLASLVGEPGEGADPETIESLQQALTAALDRIAVLESPDTLAPLTLDPNEVRDDAEPGELIGLVSGVHPFEEILTLNDAGGRLVYLSGEVHVGATPLNQDPASTRDLVLLRRLAKPGKEVIEIEATLTVNVIQAIVLDALPLEDLSVPQDLAAGAELADLGPLLPGETRTIAPDDGRVVFNEGQTKLLRGLTAWSPGEIEYVVARVLPEAANSPFDTHWTLTVDEASAGPQLNNITLRYGARTTPADSSTVLLRNIPGLIADDSAPIVAWRTGGITASGGGATGDWAGFLAENTSTETARTPNPTKGSITQLTTVTLVGSYTYTVTGVAADGAEATAIVTIEVVADAFNVGDAHGGDIMSSRFATKAGGLTWLFSSGWDRPGVYRVNNLNPTGRMGMREADPAKPMKLPGLNLDNCKRIDVYGLTMGGAPGHRFLIDSGTTDCTIRGCKSAADASFAYINADDPNVHAIFKIIESNLIVIEDNVFAWCPRPVQLGGTPYAGLPNVKDIVIRNNVFRTFHADAVAMGGSENVTIIDNVFLAPRRNDGNPDHYDGLQFTGTDPIINPTIERNVWVQAEGNTGLIGVMNTASSVTGLIYRDNVLVLRAATAMNWGTNLIDPVIEDVTACHTMSGKIGYHVDDNVTNIAPNIVLAATTNGLLARVLSSGAAAGSPTGWTQTNNIALGVAYTAITQFPTQAGRADLEPTFEPTGVRTYDFTGVFKYPDAFERLNNYGPDNLAGADYPNMTAAQIKALVLDVLTPASGVTAGAITLAGELKP